MYTFNATVFLFHWLNITQAFIHASHIKIPFHSTFYVLFLGQSLLIYTTLPNEMFHEWLCNHLGTFLKLEPRRGQYYQIIHTSPNSYWDPWKVWIDKGLPRIVTVEIKYYLKSCIWKEYEPRHDKTSKVTVRPAKTRISLGIRPVWSEYSLSAWRNLGSLATHWAHSEDSDQTSRMPRLIWVFAGRTLILLVLSCRGSYYLSEKWNLVWTFIFSNCKPT